MVMTCTPLAPLLAASTRIMCPDSLVWTTMVRRAVILDPAEIIHDRGFGL